MLEIYSSSELLFSTKWQFRPGVHWHRLLYTWLPVCFGPHSYNHLYIYHWCHRHHSQQNVMILNYEWYRQPCLSTGHCHHYIVMNVLLIAYKTCEPGLLPLKAAWMQHWRSIDEDYYSISRVWSHIEALALSNFSGCWTYMIVSFYIPCETFNLTDSQECFTYWLMFTDLFSVPVSGLSCLNTLI